MSWYDYVWDAVEFAAEDAVDAAVETVEDATQAVRDFVEDAAQWMSATAKDTGKAVADVVADVATAVPYRVTALGGSIRGWIGKTPHNAWEWTTGALLGYSASQRSLERSATPRQTVYTLPHNRQ